MTAAPQKAERLVWDDATVSRFWDYYSGKPEIYFSTVYGQAIARQTARWLPPGGRILDYGCGTGGLIAALLARGHHVGGVDYSQVAIAHNRSTFAGRPGFLGAWSPQDIAGPGLSGSFTAIFMVEVIEHMSDDHLAAAMATIKRLLAPGGRLICTTPNDEDLEAALVFCPESGKLFHPTQHVRSWTPASLTERLRAEGFGDLAAFTTDYGADIRCFPRQWAVRAAKQLLRFPHKDPHLTVTGRI